MFNNKNLKNLFIFLSILLLAGALRVHNLDKYSLWYDEAISPLQEGGMKNLPNIAKLFDSDFSVKNPDYLAMYNYGFICYWQALFGQSEFALRMSSVMFSLLTICLLYLLAQFLFNTKTAQIAAFLLAISPFHIYYSQELRPYAIVCFFTLLCVYSLSQILNNNKNRWWFIYSISSIISIYFLYINLFCLIAFLLFLIYRIKKVDIKKFIIAHSVILILLIPALLIIYHNLVFMFTHNIPVETNEFPVWSEGKVGIENLVFMFKNFSGGYYLDYFSLAGKSITFICLFFLGFSIFRFWKKDKMQLLLFCLFVPVVIIFFVFQIKNCYVYRYSFSVLPLFFLIIAAGVGVLNRVLSFFSLVAIVFLNIFGLTAYYSNHLPSNTIQYTGVQEKQDIRSAVKVLTDNYVEGDRILQLCRNTVFPLKFYTRMFKARSSLLVEIDRGTVVGISDNGELLFCDYNGMHPFTFRREDYRNVDNFKDKKRVCLVISDWHFRGLGEKECKALSKFRENFTEVKTERFKDIEIYYFNKKAVDINLK